MAKNAIGLAIATEEYGSKFFANGAQPSGVLEHPGTIKDPQRVRDSWMSQFGGSANSNKIAVLEEGLKYTPMPPTFIRLSGMLCSVSVWAKKSGRYLL